MKKFEINIGLYLLLSFICSILFINNLLILKNYIPAGYTIDIYSQLPSIFWWSLIVIYFLGSVLFFSDNFIFRNTGFVYLLINYFVIFLVPYCLGYYSYGVDDELSHLGYINNIILTGRVGPQNVYPLCNIIYTICSLLLNTNPQILSLLLPSFFSLLFVIGSLAFSRLFLSSKSNIYLFPVTLIYYFGHFHFSNIPNYTYFTLIPIILFCIVKYMLQKTVSMSITFIIFLLILPFTHPFIWVFIFFVILSLFFGSKFFDLKIKNTSTLLLLSACSFAVWFIYSYLVNLFSKSYSAFTSHQIESVGVKGAEKLSKIGLGWFDFTEFVLLYTGRYIIPFFVISIFILRLFLKKYNMPKIDLRNVYFLIFMLLLFGLFQIIFVINPFISHSPDRITNLNYMIFAMIPLFSISIYYLLQYNFMRKNIFRIPILLTFIFSLSVYGAFYSPSISQPNIATTYNELDGMNWLFHYKNEYPIHDLVGNIGIRYSNLINSPLNDMGRLGKDVLWASTANVQDHFGYDQSANYRERHEYIVITTKEELLYQTVYEHIGRFNAHDFIRFNNDTQIFKIYDSLNINIYSS